MVWQPVITEVEHLSNEETDVIATELGAPKKEIKSTQIKEICWGHI